MFPFHTQSTLLRHLLIGEMLDFIDTWWYRFEDMNIEQLEELDSYNLDLIVESLQYRLENDTNLMYHPDIKSDLEDMLAIMEDEYL